MTETWNLTNLTLVAFIDPKGFTTQFVGIVTNFSPIEMG